MTINTVKVWDPLIRIGHWTLVTAFFVAYFSEDDLMSLHIWAGYVVAGYVLLRVVWGFVGSRYARFNQFIYSPRRVILYLKQLAAGTGQHYIGHNPAGGLMVIALLLSLAATAVTGMKLYAVEENQGPFAVPAAESATQTQNLTNTIVSQSNHLEMEDEDGNENNTEHEREKNAETFWEEIHEIFANLTLLLVFLHIVGVAVSSRVDKERLLKAMLTGKKVIDDSYR